MKPTPAKKRKTVRGRGPKGGRGQGGKRLSTFFFFFLDAVLPAGPCSLTRWLEEGGKKNIVREGKREKRLKLHVRLQGERWKS